MEKTLIIHGHFYQPPRENPYINRILQQESAYPHHDWNSRITAECYQPNANSRILDGYGRIIDIVNNYEYLSFNFGPTLLDYLRRYYPLLTAKIVDADKQSMERNNGHGNAIAQAYNHIILPLARYEDMLIQIKWGIYEFEQVFERKPEGMWLSETAINRDVVDALAECGITYTILSPYQARAIKTDAGEMNVNGGKIDTTRPYRLYGRRGGEIAVFFYDGHISQAIAFEHLLTHADKFAKRINTAFENGMTMLNLATDGESYGHHEPFGDMCLAKFFSDVSSVHDIRVTNYGAFLEEHPPWQEVVLHDGTEGRGTSWSCAHGVERWRSNCGCSTGGPHEWQQEWRHPLREAFDFLRGIQDRATIETLAISESKLLPLREAYARVMYDEKDVASLYETYCESDATLAQFTAVLEAYKYALFAYTSCGWFFADVSGLEPVQNMRYADISFSYLEQATKNADFIRHAKESYENALSQAKSNIKKHKDGRACYHAWVVNKRYDQARLINHALAFLACEHGSVVSVENFSLYENTVTIAETDGSVSKGMILNRVGMETRFVSRTEKSENNIVNTIAFIEAGVNVNTDASLAGGTVYYLSDIALDERANIVKALLADETKTMQEAVYAAFNKAETTIAVMDKHGVSLTDEMKHFFSTFFTMRMQQVLAEGPDEYSVGAFPEIEDLVRSAHHHAITIDTRPFNALIETHLHDKLKQFCDDFSLDAFHEIMQVMYHIDSLALSIDRHHLENTVDGLLDRYAGKNELTKTEHAALLLLGEWFNFNVERYR